MNLTLNKPAFLDDIVYKHYFQNHTLDIVFDDNFENNDKDYISMTLRRILHKEPSERPSASKLYNEFSKLLEAKSVQMC